ncbi:MAG TPA: histidine--tRNA ligase [Candidatus Saccharimonadales bacterium]|nr:histidine--tRNA ligase [Candidatus Saccharimonadales bacterium]
MIKVLSKQEPKGTLDWTPEEFAIRKYIFDCWRRVCLRYGFEEYLTPIVENAEIYRAKSGEDVGGKELVTFSDLGGRELSIRPEMTPSVVRMVSKIYTASPKPLKYFSIANFMRNEKPQRGRNREFWQLNCDIFGSTDEAADLEILCLALDLVLEFKPPKNSFALHLNSRRLIDGVLELSGAGKLKADNKAIVVRTLDKWKKLPLNAVRERLLTTGLKSEAIAILEQFMLSGSLAELAQKLPALKNNPGFLEIDQAMKTLKNLGYGDLIEFDPSVIRGFDYYDGLVFEAIDKHPENNRSMFGGGRYNGLAEIFGEKNFPAVGFAPGDEVTKIFLENWNLLDKNRFGTPEKYYFPLLSRDLYLESQKLIKKLRATGKNIFAGLEEQKITKALEFANKKGFDKVIIFGEDEKQKHKYKIKDMKTGKEQVAS